MEKLLNHMGPIFLNWASLYFENEVANQFEDFKQKNPEGSAQIDLEIFKEKLLAYHVYSGHYINTKYFNKDINTIIQKAEPAEPGNVKLSEKLLDFIDQMQNDETDGLDCYQQAISNAVCFIGTILYQLDKDEQHAALEHFEALSLTREKMENLRG